MRFLPHYRSLLCLLALVLACGDDTSQAGNDASSASSELSLRFLNQPTGGAAGQPLAPAVTIEVVDSSGQPANEDVDVEVALIRNPHGAKLSGTLVQTSAGGVAKFNDLRIDTAGRGYQLLAGTPGTSTIASQSFTIVSAGVHQLAFKENPADQTLGEPLRRPVLVELRDEFGNLVPEADDLVDIELASTPGTLLLHASDDTLVLVDPGAPAVVDILVSDGETGPIVGAARDRAGNRIYVSDTDSSVSRFDPQPLTFATVRSASAQTVGGLTLSNDGSSLYATLLDCCDVRADLDTLFTMDPGSGELYSIGTITLVSSVGRRVESVRALATHPETDELIAACVFEGGGMGLVRLNADSGSGSLLSVLERDLDALAFALDGTLYGVAHAEHAGEPASPELVEVNVETGATLSRTPLRADPDTPTQALAQFGVRADGELRVAAAAGVVSFADLRVPATGSGYTFRASVPGLPSAESSPFDVVAPEALREPNDAPIVSFDRRETFIEEREETLEIRLTLSEASAQTVIVNVTIGGSAIGGSATDGGADFDRSAVRNPVVRLAPGTTEARISLPIIDDDEEEEDETIALTIRSAIFARVGANDEHLVTIRRNDGDFADLVPTKDTTLYETAEGDLGNGRGRALFVGRTNQPDNSIRRTLVAFDVARQVPTGATITAATLTMAVTKSTTEGSVSVGLYRVLANWGEGNSNAGSGGGSGAEAEPMDATWLFSMFDMNRWATAGGDFAPIASAETAVGPVATYTWTSPEMVADVQSWLDNPSENFGWLLRSDEAERATAKQFRSREDGGATPLLSVEYETTEPD